MRKRFSVFSVAILMAIAFTVGTWLPEGIANRRPRSANSGSSYSCSGGGVTVHKATQFSITCPKNLKLVYQGGTRIGITAVNR